MDGAKILIVDDEPEICQLTKDFLERRKYSCFTAVSEPTAIELVKQEHPLLVILDVRLGDTSGLDVLAKIKEIDKNISVIMVTGLGDEQTIQEAKSLGADDFITKPFTAGFLADLLAKKISEKESSKTL